VLLTNTPNAIHLRRQAVTEASADRGAHEQQLSGHAMEVAAHRRVSYPLKARDATANDTAICRSATSTTVELDNRKT